MNNKLFCSGNSRKQFSCPGSIMFKAELIETKISRRQSAIVTFYRSTLPVTESTIIATIHCPYVGYCLFGISLVTHIPYYVPCTFPIAIVSYWVVLSFTHLFTPLVPCTQLGYSTLPTMYYWISTSVAIPCLFDSITCFVSYILSPLYLCFRT